MARKTASRLDKRREMEAAETLDGEDGKSKKKSRKKKKAKRKSSRSKSKAPVRKRLVWGVFSGSMKEEARFPYEERDKAEEKADALRSKSKKLYFVQPIKEPIADAPKAEAKDEKSKSRKKSGKKGSKSSDEEE